MNKMKDKRGKSDRGPFILLIILLFFLALIDISTLIIWRFPLPQSLQLTSSGVESAKVVEIIDGDTIKLENGRYVRLIGIDAPEKDGQYYEESTRFLTFLLANKTIKLERDKDDTDNYGRLLRYVYVDYGGKELFINEESMKQGYSIPMFIEPNTKYKAVIEQARQTCLSEKINLCG